MGHHSITVSSCHHVGKRAMLCLCTPLVCCIDWGNHCISVWASSPRTGNRALVNSARKRSSPFGLRSLTHDIKCLPTPPGRGVFSHTRITYVVADFPRYSLPKGHLREPLLTSLSATLTGLAARDTSIGNNWMSEHPITPLSDCHFLHTQQDNHSIAQGGFPP